MDRSEELRKRLIKVTIKNPRTYKDIARDIGIGEGTLSKFMDGAKKSPFKTLGLIEKYIVSEESRQLDDIIIDF